MASEKRLGILQSNYIPWKGYFDLIASVDEFILFDDAQYTRSDWRNRNKIKTPLGAQWLTIPVETTGKHDQRINEAMVKGHAWREKHLRTILQNYSRAPFFRRYESWLRQLYETCASDMLSEINFHFLNEICKELNITTKITWSSNYQIEAGKTERLVSLCQQAGAAYYLSGPSARDYIDPLQFERANIALHFKEYSYPEYPQLYPPFDHAVTVLDLILNTGAEARHYIVGNKS